MSANKNARDILFIVEEAGTLFMVKPMTDAGYEWCLDNMKPEIERHQFFPGGEGYGSLFPSYTPGPSRFTELQKKAEKKGLT